ncbi:MAG: OFA family MFS transporter [Halanaerobiaceae bacterium]
MNVGQVKTNYGTKKWFYIILGILINICLGTVYSWSVFRKPIEGTLQISATGSGLPYMFFLFFYAISMPFAGKFIDRYKPRWIAVTGGLLVAAGWILAGYSGNIYILTISYGIIAGTGVGIVYGVPISVASKWFPEKRGLAVGLTLLGFGLSPFLTAPIARELIEFKGPLFTFRILGIAFLLIITILSLLLKEPAFKKKTESSTRGHSEEKNKDKSSSVLGLPRFYTLWSCYLIGTFSGLMAIGITSPVAEEIINLRGSTAAFTMSLFAVFNGIGRPFYGWVTDRFSTKSSALLSYILIFIASLMMLYAQEGNLGLYVIAFSLFWFNLGGWLAIAPAATGKFFSTQNYSKNYGLVFTAYGVGAILGTSISGSIRDWFGSYTYAFYPLLVISLVGIFISLKYLKPRK